jgi:ribosomal protein S18 acetylase RimI-like enzyme
LNIALKIEPATSDDSVNLRALFVSVVEGLEVYCRSMRDEQLALYTSEYFNKKIEKDRLSVLKASIDGELAGFILSTNQTGPAWIDWLITDPKFRRNGLAERLVLDVVATAPQRNVHKIWCDTRSHNYPAIRIFERLGFTKKCELLCHWHKEDYLIWEKFI